VRCTAKASELVTGSAELRLGDRADVVPASRIGLVVEAGPGDDDVHGETVDGGPSDDRLVGRDLTGGPGNDTMIATRSPSYAIFHEEPAGDGNDILLGTSGRDIVTYAGRTAPVHVDLRGGARNGQPGEHDLLADVDEVEGGAGADTLIGNTRANILSGNGGRDVLVGGAGNDILMSDSFVGGQRTADRLSGGPGDDALSGNAGPNVLDLGPGADRVDARGGADVIRAADGAIDALSCGGGTDRVRADARDFADRACERISRTGAGVAVPVSAFIDTRSDAGPTVIVGCPSDGPPRCSGRARLRIASGRTAVRRFSVPSGTTAFVVFPSRLDPRGRRFGYVAAVRSRDARGRERVVVRRDVFDFEG
jgi:Ca2+-binding RTX toxin-like protein